MGADSSYVVCQLIMISEEQILDIVLEKKYHR